MQELMENPLRNTGNFLHLEEQMDRWTDGQMDKWTVGKMDR